MGNTPSIFETTPQEHAAETAEYLDKQREILIWPPETFVPLGHVRVQFYAYRFRVRDGLRPDMESVLPLEKSGELSLFAVRRLWGLETCSIIDPVELKLGFPADLNLLPSEVVKELIAKHGCIKLIEPYTSYETLIKRQLRHIALAGTSVLQSYSVLATASARKDYRTLRQVGKRILSNAEPYYIFGTRLYIDWSRALHLILLICTVSLLFCYASARSVQRLGHTIAAFITPSIWLTCTYWAVLVVLVAAAGTMYVKSVGWRHVRLAFNGVVPFLRGLVVDPASLPGAAPN
ncbi:hypothetical protein C8R43DRAFT_993176 [Mycena crocata]|nr:hypothetical protein C8R43DRAFT_993176 [Mycena crocata]